MLSQLRDNHTAVAHSLAQLNIIHDCATSYLLKTAEQAMSSMLQWGVCNSIVVFKRCLGSKHISEFHNALADALMQVCLTLLIEM